MWFQRSRSKWLVDGDRNTKYYHIKPTQRIRSNQITLIKDANGLWTDKAEKIGKLFKDFYQDLFTKDLDTYQWLDTVNKFPNLSAEVMAKLNSPIDNGEVKKALFNMAPWKAPDPDSFPAGFFQKSWSMMSDNMCNFIQKLWNNPASIKEVNQTELIFIPKVNLPTQDPISPYIFVIYIDKLSHMIMGSVESSKWKGFKEANELGKCLGMPITGRSPKSKDFNHILENIRNKLSTGMLVIYLLQKCIKEIHKIQRNFNWGHKDEEKHIHGVNWKTIMHLKQVGGLGFCNLNFMNKACLSKLVWKLMSGENNLWSQVVKAKYDRENNNLVTVSAKPNDSGLWKQIDNIWPVLQEMAYWDIGNGNSVSIWKDCWLKSGHLINMEEINSSALQLVKVSDLVDINKEWNLSLLHSFLDMETIEEITAIHPPRDYHGEDACLWKGTANGFFTISNAYNHTCNVTQDGGNTKSWKQIWRSKVPERI
ncbi:unnamed protein product [Vicia faba]|uniref:Uncharacterized protein n=1 Tax=Vicia faba TaxID=3906 RepID=A0AAV0ZD57_VICFA|nr:unnamed protein product [Vicia faba]